MADTRPIGIFDSGIGGLTVARAIRQALPTERLLYFGDGAHVPYGPRSASEVLGFSAGITEFLLAQESKLVVIACNTASAAALAPLRERMPHVPFVGMEPAVKPAAEHTRTGVVGVLATVATVQSAVFESVVERFAQGVEVIRQACPGLVARIEEGAFEAPETEEMLRGWLEPMMARNIDALVLGCTHYPIVRPLIERIVGPGVRVIDPAPAIARRVEKVLHMNGSAAPPDATGGLACWTSGPVVPFRLMLQRLGLPVADVRAACWQGDTRVTPCTSLRT
ncbi:MAG: glutamate racemase [Flavobacteriales bacterium]|nr:glutamate racemase [Flavobacteriales bacterium]